MVKAKKRITTRRPQRKAAAKRSAPETALPTNPGEALAKIGLTEAKLAPKLRRIVLSLIAETEDLHRQLQEARARIAALEKLVDEDPLMPVCNRRAFVRELTRMMAYAERYGVPASLVYFDVNNLKQINDTHGHAAGDAVLMQVARVLVESVRATDVVGRLGGDEFGVLLVQTDKTLAEHKGKELAALIEQRPILWQGEKVPASVAFGPRSFSGGENADAVLDDADREMYRRKAGRDFNK
jgi:diguanylate cyclase (GGDEF)-like protein